MRIVWTWIVPLIVVAGIVIGISYFQGDIFHHTPQDVPQQQDVWVEVPHPPGDRVKPEVPVVKEFGAWHLSCARRPGELPAVAVPKVGYVQNFGIAQVQNGKPDPCHVFLMMRDRSAPRQEVMIMFRYLEGSDTPDLAMIYTTLCKQQVIYDKSGHVHDLTKKEKWKGGFYTDSKFAPPGQKLEAQSKNIPEVGVQLGRDSFSIPTRACMMGRCAAHQSFSQSDAITPGIGIVIRLPGPPHGQPRIVNVPSDGLGPALAELARMRTSS